MASRRAFLRLELALGVLGLTAASLVLIVAVDAVQFHATALLTGAVVLLEAVIVGRAARSLLRQLRAHRAFLRRLPVVRIVEIDGEAVRVVPGRTPHAFCAGLGRPAVYASEGLVRESRPAELRAIVAHEAHHRARRDPLRALVARVISDAFRPLPPLAMLAERQSALAELAADAAAVRRVGDVRPVASALARFDAMHALAGGGIAPERVDQLVRAAPPQSVSAWLLAAAGLALAGLIALGVGGWHPEPAAPIALEVAAIAVACVPSYLAARRVDACLRPAG